MAIKLYGRPLSPFVRVATLVLAEKAVQYELLQMDQKSPEFLATLNPFGKHPVLDIDGFILYESRAIARYIATKFADQGAQLLGSTEQEKALIDQWIDVEGHTFQPPALQIVVERLIKPKLLNLQGNEAIVEENSTKLEQVLNVYEAHLAKSKFLAGDSYTLADMVHTPMLFYLVILSGKGDLVRSRKHLNAWFENISSRPAWLTVLNDGQPVPPQA